jgi:PAS domain S-box-containing protein
MSWITVVWSMIVSTCLTLALVHLAIWLKQTAEFAYLLFSTVAISVAAIGVCEFLTMYARSPEQYGRILWWAHIPVFFAVVCIVGFVRLYFQAGRLWLGFSACGLRLLDLIINFFSVPNVNYLQITGLRQIRFLGETISIARGLESPWIRVSELSSLLVLLFVVDASITLWRRGQPNDRHRAVVVGGSITFFILVAAGIAALIEEGLISSPYLISLPFLAILLAMGYELSSDTVRAARLVRQLQASESALRESEARFRVLADTAPVMVWMSGPDMLCDFFNKQWLEFTGRTIEQELGNGWSEGVHAEDLQGCHETYTSSFQARQPFSMEYRLRRADGEYRWILDTGVPRYRSEGEFAGYIGSAIDITDRRLAAAALRESEQNMSLAAASADMAMWMWDIPRDEVWTTDNGRAFLGYGKSEKISFERFLTAVHPEDRETVREGVMKAVNGAGEYDGEYRVVVAGQTLWIAGRGRVEFDGGRPVRMRGASLDITLRKQAEERFRVVVEAAPNAMIVVNSEGKIELMNAEVESVFGYSRQELVGQPVEILVPEQSRSDHSDYRHGYFADPKARAMGAGRELFGKRKDGTEVPVEIGLSPLHTSAGVFVLASIVEITERRKTDLELARQRNELAHLSRVALLGELSISLAHELNQPLTAILSDAQAAQLLLTHKPADLDELPEILREIEGQSKRAGEVIRGLRALLKKGEMRHVPLDVNEVVNKVLKLIRSDLINQRVGTQIELAPDLPLIDGDEVQLQQVLLNLVVNACDAMGEVEAIDRRLLICTELRTGRVVQVSVVDRGRGIPPAKIEHIFEPFFTTKHTGMGLGLAVCRTIISAHGGEIWAINNPKRGATFQFTLSPNKQDNK